MRLGNEFDEWNRAAKAQSDVFSKVRDHAANYLFRVWMHALPPHQFMILCFIYDRTFRFSKYAEAIPRKHFLSGIQEGGSLKMGNNGYPICCGLGRSFRNSASTFSTHMDDLLLRGIVETLDARRGGGRPVRSYIFMRMLLRQWIVLANGSLPVGEPWVQLAPALLQGVPVRILHGRLTAEEEDEFFVLAERQTTGWVHGTELHHIEPEDWAQIKRDHRWVEQLPDPDHYPPV
jgi:hypothetical protein